MFPLPNVSTSTAATASSASSFAEFLPPAPLVSGRRIQCILPGWRVNSLNIVIAVNNLYWNPFFVRKTGVYDRIGVYNTSSTTASFKVAIYDDTGALIEDLGTLALSGTAGIAETAINRTFTANKLYFYAIKGNSSGSGDGNLLAQQTPGVGTTAPTYYKDVVNDYLDFIPSLGLDPYSLPVAAAQSYATAMPSVLPTATLASQTPAIVFLRAA